MMDMQIPSELPDSLQLPSELPDSLPYSSINSSGTGSSIDITSEARDLNWIADDEDLYSEGFSESPLEKLRSMLKITRGNVNQCEEVINEITSFDEDLISKCETIAVTNLLPRNSNLADAGNFKVISAGVDILVKYGINLLKPKRNPNWRSIKLSNAAFKNKVQPLKGYEDVLQELGYSERSAGSFDFLPSLQNPDIEKVAVVTADLLILQKELNQFVDQVHVNRERFLKYFSSFQVRDLSGGPLPTVVEGIALNPISNQKIDPVKVADAVEENCQVKAPVPAPRKYIPQAGPRETKPTGQPQPSVKSAPTVNPLATMPSSAPMVDNEGIEIVPSVGEIKHPPSRVGGYGVCGSDENPLMKPAVYHAWQDPHTQMSAGGKPGGPNTTPHAPPRNPQNDLIKDQGPNTKGLRTPADFTPYPVTDISRSETGPPELTIRKPPQMDWTNKPQVRVPSQQLTQPHPQDPASSPDFAKYSNGGSSATSQKEPSESTMQAPPLVDRKNKPQVGVSLNQQQPHLFHPHSQVSASAADFHQYPNVGNWRPQGEPPGTSTRKPPPVDRSNKPHSGFPAGYHLSTGTAPPLPEKPTVASRCGSGTSVTTNQEPLHTLIGKSVGPPSNEYRPSPNPQRQLPPGAQPTPFMAHPQRHPPQGAQPTPFTGVLPPKSGAAHVKQDIPQGMSQHGQRETATSSGSKVTKRVVTRPLEPLEDCAMCEGKPGIIHCDKCQSARCEACDRRWHSHPRRKAHETRKLVVEEVVIEREMEVEVEEKKEECFVCGENATFHCITCSNFFCSGCDERFHRIKERQNHERIKLGNAKNPEQDAFLPDPSITGAKPKISSPVKAKTEERKKPDLPPPTREEMLHRQHEEVVAKDIEVLEKIEIVSKRCRETLDRALEQQLMQEEKILRNQHLHLMDELAVIDEEINKMKNGSNGEIQARGTGRQAAKPYRPSPSTVTTSREDGSRVSPEEDLRSDVRQNNSQRQRRPMIMKTKWVCGHCTFRNEDLDDKICGVCSKTTSNPEIVEEQEEDVERKDEADIRGREPPCETEMYIQHEIQEAAFEDAPEVFQREDDFAKRQENLSYRLLCFYNEAKDSGYTLEDVKTAWDIMEHEGDELPMTPVEWLDLHLQPQLQMILGDITKEFCRTYAMEIPDQIQNAFSLEEIHEAWWRNDGNRDNTAAECLELLHEKVEELHSTHHHMEKINIAYSLMENGFKVHQARWNLEEQSSQEDARKVQEWMNKLWETPVCENVLEEVEKSNLDELEKREKIRRILMAEHKIVWAAVDTVFSLREECGQKLIDCVEAVKEMGGLRAKEYFKDCCICYDTAPLHKLLTLPMCQCDLCTECVTGHFSVLAQNTSCMERFVCPACNEPDLQNCTPDEYEAHFTLLSTMLRACLDKNDYELYQQKLVNWGLIADENFRWCAHGCGAGFINERLGVKKVQCPECEQYQCFDCMKPWLDQHDNISCEEFDAWKKANDPEFQQQGLAAHLKENGINCPKCKMRYELAKGGCMHFKCPHCRHEFCCGCNLPFLRYPTCQKLPSCNGKGLHAHHPRDCFYHLRDEECETLQQLLTKHNVAYNQATNAAAAANGEGPAQCPVKEQHEGPNGLEDAICGKAIKDQCGLCENHYKEYLVGLINQNNIDPVDIFDVGSLETTLRRNEKQIPNRGRNETEAAYREQLKQEIQQQLPLRPRNVQGAQGVAPAANQI